MFIDTHCHLDFPEFDQDRDEVIQRAKVQGIDYIINIGSSLEGSRSSLELARKYDYIYATVGIHPHAAETYNEEEEIAIRELAKKEKVVAIGEIGLDYYLPAGQAGKNYSPVEHQRLLFFSLLKLAKELALPLIIHTRQAQDDTLKILKEVLPIKAVVHCFSGEEDFLSECLNLGFFISFTCNITYKKAGDLRKLIKAVPLDRLLLETDAPYLSPEGFRGKRNEPAYVKYLAQEVARIKEVSMDRIAGITTDNAKQFFNIK